MLKHNGGLAKELWEGKAYTQTAQERNKTRVPVPDKRNEKHRTEPSVLFGGKSFPSSWKFSLWQKLVEPRWFNHTTVCLALPCLQLMQKMLLLLLWPHLPSPLPCLYCCQYHTHTHKKLRKGRNCLKTCIH